MSRIDLSREDTKQLGDWIGLKHCRLSLVYSAYRDGCSPEAFHAKCNYRSPVLVVASNAAGYVFGGYAPVPWTASNSAHISAPEAFLFRLKSAGNEPACMKFAAKDTSTSIRSVTTCGPWFGNTSNQCALQFFTSAIGKSGGEQGFFTCPQLSVNLSYGFQQNDQDNNTALHGGDINLSNIEVYAVQGVATLSDPADAWRKDLGFNETTLSELKRDIVNFHPPKGLQISKANILLIGQVGAGKSSFYNTLNTSFQGHVTVKATSGSSMQSVTKKFRQYELRPGRGERPLSLRLCDTMGLEDQHALDISDVPYILDGNVQNGFQFNPSVRVTPKHPDFVAVPEEKDLIHVVAIIVDATTVSSMSTKLLTKLRTIVTLASDREIPVAVILTKIDEVCDVVSRDVSLVFRSRAVGQCVETLAEKLGILANAVLPVKNYNREHALSTAVGVLSLYALLHLTRMADDVFDDQMEQKGLYEDEGAKTGK